MSTAVLEQAPQTKSAEALKEIWFTRCPVPTATGLAYKLGWLKDEFVADGVAVETIQEASREYARFHYDHELPSLIREGGNILAFAARAQGAKTKLIGLTWIEESQAILVRPDSGITDAKQLKGLRLALPGWNNNPIPSHVRGTSINRGMSLHGYEGALTYAGLTFNDVSFVEVEAGWNGQIATRETGRNGNGNGGAWSYQALVDKKVDAIYVKGAASVDAARKFGVVVGIDLDRLPDRRLRVNNGTPRPITVHESLLENHFDYVVRFLGQTLRAADWAAGNLEGVREVLQGETRGSDQGVAAAYRDGFHKSLHPDLSGERLALFDEQKKFLGLHGFLERDFDLESWVDRRPIEAARKWVNESKSSNK
jgi:ABC-type nitrate/sulfonate/bicarbonate transport system substrate-binding protein